MPFSPPEDELRRAIIDLKSQNPSLGISKVHAYLLAMYPNWTVSEKRTRKILQAEGLTMITSSHSGSFPQPNYDSNISVFPSSRVIPHLDTRRWSPRVAVRYIDNKKGKGLLATEDIAQGETLWREDPFIIAPEWEIYDLQAASAACSFCTTPLSPDSPLVLNCSATSSSSSISPSSSSTAFCAARFCNRLCQSRSAKTHPLICPAQNPASVPVLKFASETRWMALHALTQTTSRILLANQQQDDFGVDAEWQFVRALAEMGMEERYKYSFKSAGHPEPDRATWKKAFELYVQAFKQPTTVAEQKRLGRMLKKPLQSDIDQELFDYNGFLRHLGKMNLNLEGHGGLYTLHSHLNHSCNPNVSVRHLDQRTALARITVIAKTDIKAGQELLVTYVNPDTSLKTRRAALEAWGFGECRCERCAAEEAKFGKAKVTKDEMDDLEKELKAGLGVM
ncbi:hypothetical protein AX17_003047 [Amanita inopinata Kibby_2008]|nr:hypothetical protein AX17_003047 [Amanita inopinata Kibby_2008]